MGSDPEQYLTERQVASLLGLSTTTLRRYRAARIGPEWVRLGGRVVRYQRSAVDAWVRGQQVSTSA